MKNNLPSPLEVETSVPPTNDMGVVKVVVCGNICSMVSCGVEVTVLEETSIASVNFWMQMVMTLGCGQVETRLEPPKKTVKDSIV